MQTLQQVENYTALSERASEYLLAVIRSKPDAVICLATGATPLLTYHYLVEKIHQQQVDISQLTFVKLDEWVDLPLTMPGTCETFLQQHIVQPLGLREDQLISFRSEEINETECERVTNPPGKGRRCLFQYHADGRQPALREYPGRCAAERVAVAADLLDGEPAGTPAVENLAATGTDRRGA